MSSWPSLCLVSWISITSYLTFSSFFPGLYNRPLMGLLIANILQLKCPLRTADSILHSEKETLAAFSSALKPSVAHQPLREAVQVPQLWQEAPEVQVFTLSPASSAAAPEHRRHLRCSTHTHIWGVSCFSVARVWLNSPMVPSPQHPFCLVKWLPGAWSWLISLHKQVP